MDKTPLREADLAPTCASCGHLDKRDPQRSLCRRRSPQVVGGIIMVQQIGQLSPTPHVMSEAYWPVIGDPSSHWCGEHT